MHTIFIFNLNIFQVLVTSVEAPAGYSDLASVAVTGAAKPHLVHISTLFLWYQQNMIARPFYFKVPLLTG